MNNTMTNEQKIERLEKVATELYAACEAAWGQCLVMGPYLGQPLKGKMEVLETMCKKALDNADKKQV